MTVIADTGGLYAAYDRDDAFHHDVCDVLADDTELVIPPLVLAELDYLVAVRLGEAARAEITAELAEAAVVAEFTQQMFISAAEIASAYGEIGLGLTDASVAVTAYTYRTREILTVDQRHFRALRPLPGTPGTSFRLLPFDAED